MPLLFHLFVLLFSLLRLTGAPAPEGDPPAPEGDDPDIDEQDVTKLKAALKAERKEKRDAVARNKAFEKEKAEREAAAKKAAEDKAKADGEFEKLAKQREEENERLKAEIAKRDRDALRAKVAAKHKLPEALANRLHGETEAELEADAAELAKLNIQPKAPDTEAGKGGKGDSSKPPEQERKQPYVFQQPGDVPW